MDAEKIRNLAKITLSILRARPDELETLTAFGEAIADESRAAAEKDVLKRLAKARKQSYIHAEHVVGHFVVAGLKICGPGCAGCRIADVRKNHKGIIIIE